MAVRGTKADPLSGGYTCVKGRDLPDSVHSAERLRTALKRRADGSFEEISTSQALDEIAERLTAIREKYGARAIASFCGTAGYSNSATIAVVKAWHRAIGSINNFSTMTVDQPAKVVVPGRVGAWGGGWHTFASADVVMSIGNNPIVSGLTLPGGPPGWNPSHTVREAIKRGLKLIVVDPRKTQLAKLAHLHLQIRPGEDPTLARGHDSNRAGGESPRRGVLCAARRRARPIKGTRGAVHARIRGRPGSGFRGMTSLKERACSPQGLGAACRRGPGPIWRRTAA